MELFHCVFNHSLEGKEVSKQLLTFNQSFHQVAKFALEFRMIVVGSRWNDLALKAFHRGLHLEILTNMACQDEPLTLD